MCVCVCVLVRYANRARNIRNSPVVNRDPNSQLVASLRRHTHTHAQDREDHEASWSSRSWACVCVCLRREATSWELGSRLTTGELRMLRARFAYLTSTHTHTHN